MSPRPEPERSLHHSILDGCAQALSVGVGEAYLSPFAIFLGASSFLIAMLASLPLLVGSLAQLACVRLLDRQPIRRPLVVWPCLLQSLSWAPLVGLPLLFPEHGPVVLLSVVGLYFAAGGFPGPAWNSWMGDLVTPSERGTYFGRRESLRTAVQIIGLLAAGATLRIAHAYDLERWGFVIIFLVAMIARLISTQHLAEMREPPQYAHRKHERFALLDFLRQAPRNNFGRFSVYVALVQAATNIAAPFFVPYMLRDLKFSYLQFTASGTVLAIAMYLTQHNWGRVSDRIGNRRVLAITGLSVPVLPILWMLSTRFELILMFQLLSGFLWAGFNLSVANFIFDAVRPERRARSVAYYNLLVNGGIFLGAGLGGWLAPQLPSEFVLFDHAFHLVSSFQLLFLISGVGRLAVSLMILPAIREVRDHVETPSNFEVITQAVGLFPLRGFVLSIFTGVHPDDDG